MQFKGIPEILDKFTFAQRILALLMLLVTVLLITLGPKLIDALTISNTECIEETKRQDNRIGYLEKVVDTLNFKMIDNQRKCTNDITRREAEFISMLDELKRDFSRTRDSERRTIRKIELDTVSLDSIKPVVIQKVVIPDNRILNKIEMMKKKVKEDLK